MPQHAVLLLSDIVDSTRLIQALGDNAYAALFDAHDTIVRELAALHRGRELSRSDGVLMRFHAVGGAASFAIAYHHALADLHPDFRARIGIHVGPLELREVDDLRASTATVLPGLTVPMTARVAALASGGRTLLSSAAREALGASKHRLISHGHWRLKGVAEPIEVFEVGDASAAFVPPRDESKAYRVVQRHGLWLPRREIAHTLPAERDRFVGRTAALEALAALVDGDARLITVVGPGGGGKTRLVQRFGWRWLGDFEGGVWYCDLAQATTCDGLVSATAQGLALQLGASPPIEQIATAIAGRGRCLVILDNFEQLLRFGRETLERWLDAAADAQFIVTSRTVLGLPGETVYRLASMEPAESAALFIERARASIGRESGAGGDGAGTKRWLAHEAAAIDAVVRLLDGIPLAIELASARLLIMDPPTLLKRMRERFTLLATGNRTGRHATLRATLDWSWELLSPIARTALAQVSVFEGGFDLAAFEAVIQLPDDAGATPLDVLQSLVEQSLVHQVGPSRFALLVSVQEYAAESLHTSGRLTDSGPVAAAGARQRHCEYFASISDQQATHDRCVEIDNLVAAVHRAVALGLPDEASLALVNAWAALKQCGPYRTGAVLAEQVDGIAACPDAVVARVCFVAGSALQDMGDVQNAQERFDRGLDAARRGGAAFEQARLMRARGELELAAGREDAAASTLDEALVQAEATGSSALRCAALNALGTLAQTQGDNLCALDRYGAALRIAEDLGDERWFGGLLGNLGNAYYGLGRYEEANSHYHRSLAIAERFGDQRWIGNTRSNMGLVLSDQGQHKEAVAQLSESLAIARRLGHLRLECFALWNIAINCAARGDDIEALANYRAARALAVRLDDRRAQVALDAEIAALESLKTP